MVKSFLQLFTVALLLTVTMCAVQHQSSSGSAGSGGMFSGSSFSSAQPGGQQAFTSFGNVANVVPSLVRILVRRGSISNLSQGNGQLSLYNDATGVHVVANGQRFDSNDVVGPYVVTNENGPLVRREYTKEDEEYEEKQKQTMRDAWNKMDDSFASNWKNFRPMQPMQPFRMKNLF